MGKALPSLFISANFEQMSVCYTNICRRFFVLSMNDDENEWWGSGEVGKWGRRGPESRTSGKRQPRRQQHAMFFRHS